MHKKILSVLSLIGLFTACNQSSLPVGQHYIAHAGGMIGGYIYTNSREAVEQSIADGISFIELDLAFTEDSQLVCLHDWALFNRITTGEESDTPMSLHSFRTQKICGKFTPLTADDVLQIWNEHPYLWLVTDKISQPEIIEKYFSPIKSRTIVECFTKEDYRALRQSGFTTYLSYVPPSVTDTESCRILSDYHNYVFSTRVDRSNLVFRSCALFSCGNRQEADSLFALDDKIKFIYIDDTTP